MAPSVENSLLQLTQPGQPNQLYPVADGANKQSASTLLYITDSLSKYASSLQEYHLRCLQRTHNQNEIRPKQNGKKRKKNKRSKLRKKNRDYQNTIPNQAFQISDSMRLAAKSQTLLLERTYLLSSLQREDQRATDILNKIRVIQQYLKLPFHNILNHEDEESSSLDGLLMKPFPQVQKRKLVRQLNHLKNRLSEINQQEACMLVRLEQVTNEIQTQGQPRIVIEEEPWGFADEVNLHNYGWGFGGMGGIDKIDKFATQTETNLLKVSITRADTPASGISPRAQSPVEIPIEATVLNPRAPPFVQVRRHSLVNWAETQYKHIMNEVKIKPVSSSRNESDLSPHPPPPSFSNPSKTKRSSLVNWSETQYTYIFNQTQQMREEREGRENTTAIGWVEGHKTVKIHKAREHKSMQASIIEFDSPEEPSPKSSTCLQDYRFTSTENPINLSSSKPKASISFPENVTEQDEIDPKNTLLGETYQIGLAKIRAASMTLSYTSTSNDSSEDEDENIDSASIPPRSRGPPLIKHKKEIEKGVAQMSQNNNNAYIGYSISVPTKSLPSPCRGEYGRAGCGEYGAGGVCEGGDG